MQLQTIDFHGDALEYLQQGEQRWLPLRRFCDALGIDAEAQRKRLADPERSPWACTSIMEAQVGGQGREIFCLNLDTLLGWLFTIDSSRVTPEARDKIVRYQREVPAVLRAHFFPARPAGDGLTGVERFRRRERLTAALVAAIEAGAEAFDADLGRFATACAVAGRAALQVLDGGEQDEPIPYRLTRQAGQHADGRPGRAFSRAEGRHNGRCRVPAEIRAEALRLYDQGIPAIHIARTLGTSPTSVGSWVKRRAGSAGGVR